MKDLTGRTFHCLTVLEFTHIDRSGHAIWRCDCSCGKSAPASSSNLLSGRKKSCGHLRRDYLKKRPSSANKAARRTGRGTDWSIDDGLDELGAMG